MAVSSKFFSGCLLFLLFLTIFVSASSDDSDDNDSHHSSYKTKKRNNIPHATVRAQVIHTLRAMAARGDGLRARVGVGGEPHLEAGVNAELEKAIWGQLSKSQTLCLPRQIAAKVQRGGAAYVA